jgi:cytochrome c-type biogenesis protein CcmE
LYALRQNISLFYTPTELLNHQTQTSRLIRLGGLVVEKSLLHGQGLQVEFDATDGQHQVHVHYNGVLPDLFREGKSMVAEGQWRDGVFHARTVLAKHDENYMPQSVKDAIDRTQKGETA